MIAALLNRNHIHCRNEIKKTVREISTEKFSLMRKLLHPFALEEKKYLHKSNLARASPYAEIWPSTVFYFAPWLKISLFTPSDSVNILFESPIHERTRKMSEGLSQWGYMLNIFSQKFNFLEIIPLDFLLQKNLNANKIWLTEPWS